MTSERTFSSTPLFGGAMMVDLPSGFGDVSNLRQVPDHQEVYLDNTGFASIIFEINERVDTVQTDEEALRYHLDDLIDSRDEGVKIWSSSTVAFSKLPPNTSSYTLFATHDHRQRPSASSERSHTRLQQQESTGSEPGQRSPPDLDLTGILLTLIRLEAQTTDLLININIPHVKGEYDESSVQPETGRAGPLLDQAMVFRDEIFKSFEIRDWGLFVHEGEVNE
ncbi:MAG: hypothetical protein M1837_005540 [Sclerophora amabilis]|nr:MAG: hypothetical protein M1837_005540 [Sclerophora amabilis]